MTSWRSTSMFTLVFTALGAFSLLSSCDDDVDTPPWLPNYTASSGIVGGSGGASGSGGSGGARAGGGSAGLAGASGAGDSAGASGAGDSAGASGAGDSAGASGAG